MSEQSGHHERAGFSENRPILLVVVPWKERALLLAELQERGHEVRALPGIVHAIGYVIRRPQVQPALVVLDVNDDPDISARTLRDLAELTEGAPWVIITSATRRVDGLDALPQGQVHTLRRPVRVEDVVNAVATCLGRADENT